MSLLVFYLSYEFRIHIELTTILQTFVVCIAPKNDTNPIPPCGYHCLISLSFVWSESEEKPIVLVGHACLLWSLYSQHTNPCASYGYLCIEQTSTPELVCLPSAIVATVSRSIGVVVIQSLLQ